MVQDDERIELELQETQTGWLFTGPNLRFPFRILEEADSSDATFLVIPSDPESPEVHERFTPQPRLLRSSTEDSWLVEVRAANFLNASGDNSH